MTIFLLLQIFIPVLRYGFFSFFNYVNFIFLRCGHCVGGLLAVDELEGLDRCGVCNGNSSCVGCDGMVNSTRRRDLCGMCLPPTAEQWNGKFGCYDFLRILNLKTNPQKVVFFYNDKEEKI